MRQLDEKKEGPSRRDALKTLATAAGAAAIAALPHHWEKPGFQVGMLPVFAQASPIVTLSNLAITLDAVDGCGLNSDLYTARADYNDPTGAVVSGSVLHFAALFQPSGISSSFGLPTPDIRGDGFAGTIGASVCIGFSSDTSVDLTITVKNANGGESNAVTHNLPNPTPLTELATDSEPAIAPR